MIPTPVEVLHLLRSLCMDSCHKTHHLASGHLSVDTLLNNLVTFQFTKDAGDISVICKV